MTKINIKLKLTLNTLALLIIYTLTINATFAQLHVAKPNGNVGIGIDAPTEKLVVNGNTIANGNMIANGIILSKVGIIRTGNDANGSSSLQIGKNRNVSGSSLIDTYPIPGQPWVGRFLSNADGLTTFSHQGDDHFLLKTLKPTSDIRFFTTKSLALGGSGSRLTIKPDGKIGIGTNEPQAKLHLNSEDAVKQTAGEWSGISDKRTKNNINQYTKGLEEILQINPVTYNYNGKAGITDTESAHIGLIAQEFAEIEPGAVKPFSYTEEGSNKTEEYLSMNASSIKYMLVNAIKEQQAKIENQKAELETLKETVAKLVENGASISTHGATEISVLIEGTGTEKALLAQNTPNPFTTNTRIEYFIPENSRHTRMSFRDMNGKELKQVNIEHDGIGAIELSAKELAAGIYSYVLYINGDIVASKKMILEQ